MGVSFMGGRRLVMYIRGFPIDFYYCLLGALKGRTGTCVREI